MKKLLFLGLLLGLPVVLAAQVFPDLEYLHVVYLRDGSVLRGEILEDDPEGPVAVMIYGGTTFVVARENVERIEEEPNPDYGKTWLQIDIGEGRRAPVSPDRDPVVPSPERVPGQFLGEGHLLGFSVSMAQASYGGRGWDEVVDPYDPSGQDRRSLNLGVSYRFLRQARPDVAPWWMWGVATGVYWGQKYSTVRIDDPRDEFSGIRVGWEFKADLLELPLELLIGGGGDRFAGYIGVGSGVSILVDDPESLIDGEDVGTPFDDDYSQFSPVLILSVGGFARILPNVTGEVRFHWDRQLRSWYSDYTVLYETLALTLGVAYHFGR